MLSKIKGKISIYDLLYLFVFALWFVPNSIIMTEWNTVIKVVGFKAWYVVYFRYAVLVFVYFMADKVEIKELVKDLIFLAIAYVASKHSDISVIFIMTAFAIPAKKIGYRKVFIFGAVEMILLMIATVSGSIIGVIPNTDWNPALRCLAFGYDYCTYWGYAVFFLTLIFMIIRKRFTIYEMILPLALQVVTYVYCDTLTTLLLTIIVFVMYLVITKGFKKIPKLVGLLGSMVPFGALGLSVLTAEMYRSGDMGDGMSNMSSMKMRFVLANKALHTYPLTLWGQKIKYVGAGTQRKHPELEYNYVDNFFIKNLLAYGVIFMAAILIAFTILIYKAYKRQQYGIFVALIGLMGFGMLDAELMDLRFHPIYMIIASAWAYEDIRDLVKGKIPYGLQARVLDGYSALACIVRCWWLVLASGMFFFLRTRAYISAAKGLLAMSAFLLILFIIYPKVWGAKTVEYSYGVKALGLVVKKHKFNRIYWWLRQKINAKKEKDMAAKLIDVVVISRSLKELSVDGKEYTVMTKDAFEEKYSYAAKAPWVVIAEKSGKVSYGKLNETIRGLGRYSEKIVGYVAVE